MTAESTTTQPQSNETISAWSKFNNVTKQGATDAASWLGKQAGDNTKQKASELAVWLRKDSSDATTKESAKGWYSKFAEILDIFASSIDENPNGNNGDVPATGEAPKIVDKVEGANY